MKGYLLNFFKYAAIDIENFEETDTWYRNTHAGDDFVRSVVWSVFDRLEIREIDKFEDFRLSQASEKKWVGERQFSLLYEMNSKNKKLQYWQDEDKCKFTFHKVYAENVTSAKREDDERRFRFFGISMIDLTPEMHAYFYSRQNADDVLYTEMSLAIDTLISENNVKSEDVCYELYGTLGGNDLAVIWLANEYRDVVTIIEALRKSYNKRSTTPVIANISTIMGLRDINNKNISYENVKGKFNIRFTKKGTYDEEEFKEALRDCLGLDDISFDTTLGEHDLSWKVDAIVLTKKLYGEDGVVHIGKDAFINNIIQANTELSVELDYNSLKPYVFKKSSSNSRTVIALNEKKEVYDNIKEITEIEN